MQAKGASFCNWEEVMKISFLPTALIFAAHCYAMESLITSEDAPKEAKKERVVVFTKDKQELHDLVIRVTDAKLNVVQGARDFLLTQSQKINSQSPVVSQIKDFLLKLIQPQEWLHKVVLPTDIDHTLVLIEQFASQLEVFYRANEDFRRVLKPVVTEYRSFVAAYKSNPDKRQELLLPKAFLLTESSDMAGPLLKSFLIDQDMALKITSLSGFSSGGICTFDKQNIKGAHAVCSLVDPQKKEGVHFKANSETELQVGYESAVYWFSYLLFGHGQAASSLVTVSNIATFELPEDSPIKDVYAQALKNDPARTFFIGSPQCRRFFVPRKYSTILQASHHIAGTSLDDFIKEQIVKKSQTHLDLTSFGEQVLLNLLTVQSDFKPDNLMVRQDESASLIGIDNDVAFGSPIKKAAVFVRPGRADQKIKHLVALKNILFLLPAMKEPVAEPVVAAIKKIDPDVFIMRWLELLRYQELRYEAFKNHSFLNEDFKDEPFLSGHNYEEALCLPIRFSLEFIRRLKENIKNMQEYFRTHKGASHWQLFNLVEPVVAKCYKEFFDKKGDVITTFFKAIYQKKVEKQTYIEDLVDLDEILHGKTVKELLEKVNLPNASIKKYSIAECVKLLLSETDLFEKQREQVLPAFLTSVYNAFTQEFLEVQEAGGLHQSWNGVSKSGDNLLILLMIEAGLDESVLRWFITEGGCEILFDEENIVCACLENSYSTSFISFLLRALEKEYAGLPKGEEQVVETKELAALLNRPIKNGSTALDLAMREGKRREFRLFIEHGARACDPKNALSYYVTTLKSSKAHQKDFASFAKLMDRNQAVEWEICLHNLLPLQQEKITGIDIVGSDGTTRSLVKSIEQQIYDADKKFKPAVQEGANHVVACARMQDSIIKERLHGIYFKELPSIPGREEAAGRFMRRLFGYGAPHTLLVKMHNPVMLSHEMEGPTLAQAFKDRSPALQKLDPKNISGLIIAAMLINPEDGKPNNLVLVKNKEGDTYSLSIVDNDNGFIEPLVRQKRKFSDEKGSIKLRVKTVLYCLDQMKEIVHPAIRARILEIDPLAFLEEWASDLGDVHENYLKLFTGAEHATHLKSKCITQGIPFWDDAVVKIYDKIVLLQNILLANSGISHIDLLCRLEPGLGKIYQDVLLLDVTPMVRWQKVDGPSYKHTPSGVWTTLSQEKTILSSALLPAEKPLLELVQEAGDFTVLQAVDTLKEKLSKNNQEVVQELLKKARERDADFQHGALSIRQWEKLLANPGMVFDSKQQKALLKIIQKEPFVSLALQHLTLVAPAWFSGVNYDHLTKLDLRSCQEIKDVAPIVKRAELLEELNIGKIVGLVRLSDSAGLQETDLNLFRLRRLSVAGCTKLRSIKIAAPFLVYLNISDCPLVTTPIVDEIIKVSREIEKIDCANSGVEDPLLTEAFPQFISTELIDLPSRIRHNNQAAAHVWLLYRLGNYFELGPDFNTHRIIDKMPFLRRTLTEEASLDYEEGPVDDDFLDISEEEALPAIQYDEALRLEYSPLTKDNLERAAHMYSDCEFPEAVYKLAQCYKRGIGVQADLAKAIKLYRRAYNKLGFNFPYYLCRNSSVMGSDYRFFARSKEIPPAPVDRIKAYVIYKYIFNMVGETFTFPAFGLFRYFSSEILTRKWLKAHTESALNFIHFLLCAAEEEMSVALYNLALCYEYGFGVTKDPEEAGRLRKKFLIHLQILAHESSSEINVILGEATLLNKYSDACIRFFMDVLTEDEIHRLMPTDVLEKNALLAFFYRFSTEQSDGFQYPILSYNLATIKGSVSSLKAHYTRLDTADLVQSILDHPESILYSPHITRFIRRKMEQAEFQEIKDEFTGEQIAELVRFLKITFAIPDDTFASEKEKSMANFDPDLYENNVAFQAFLHKLKFSVKTVYENYGAFRAFLFKKEHDKQ